MHLASHKLVFLTGLLTALLFIGTAHGRQFDEQALELEELQALMEDSNAVMETGDEDEIAEAQSVIDVLKKVGCAAAKIICKSQTLMDNRATTQDIKDFIAKSKAKFCAATTLLCLFVG